MKKLWAAVVVASAVVVAAAACGGTNEGPQDPGPSMPGNPGSTEGGDTGNNVVDAGSPVVMVDAGFGEDAGTPVVDAGVEDAGVEDAGVKVDAGMEQDAGPIDAGPGPGPWPTTAVKNYSASYDIPWVQSVGIDDGHNIWLLKDNQIGVLRPGTSKPVWATGIGQAKPGFGKDKLAEGSTVICGGAAGQAYVGYWTYDLLQPERTDPKDEEFKKGDLDVVQLNADGSITLLEHLHKSVGTSQPWPMENVGIRNSIDWHYDEDRSVLTCQRVMKGPYKGELYIGTNHGVTRIRGLEYNAHRHPVWDVNGSLRIGYSHGLGIAQNGDVLIANEWKVGIATPPPALGDWEFFGPTPWKLDTYNDKLNSLEAFDYWRAIQQTTDGKYYVASLQYGLWELGLTAWAGSANWTEVKGLPTNAINALVATDDGSLYIGTDDAGLWVMDAQKSITKVTDVPGAKVQQLVYDPTVSPSMLLVLTTDALTVVRGK